MLAKEYLQYKIQQTTKDRQPRNTAVQAVVDDQASSPNGPCGFRPLLAVGHNVSFRTPESPGRPDSSQAVGPNMSLWAGPSSGREAQPPGKTGGLPAKVYYLPTSRRSVCRPSGRRRTNNHHTPSQISAQIPETKQYLCGNLPLA